MYKNIQCKTALNKLDTNYLPYHWDLNVFRGCVHKCRYCYAQYSHGYLGSGDFFGTIYIKENIVEALERNLRSKNWKHETVNLGGVTDSYQPIEAVKKFMPDILKLLIKYRTPVSISTKSSLLLRDRDMFVELAKTAGAHVAVSVTTMDEALRKKLEPGSSPTIERFRILEAFKGTPVMTGVLMMPILPYLTDNMENLESLYRSAQEARADYIIPGLLNLRQPTKGHFLNFIKTTFPELYTAYMNYYSGRSDKKTYRETVYGRISKLKKMYPLSPKNNPFPKPPEQLQLF